jgi:hypothetical protein
MSLYSVAMNSKHIRCLLLRDLWGSRVPHCVQFNRFPGNSKQSCFVE